MTTENSGAALRREIMRRAKVLRGRIGDVLKRGNAAAIHDARVAGRRLREALASARHLDQTVPRRAERTARDATRTLSNLRTVDALAELLDQLEVPAAAEPDRRRVRRNLQRRRRKLYLDASRELHKKAFVRLTEQSRQVADGVAREIAVSSRVEVGAPIRQRLRALQEHLENLGSARDPEALHRARILVKRLRYAAEMLQPTERSPLGEFLLSLRRAQELGGTYHDLELLRVEALATAPAANVLADFLKDRVEIARKEFVAALRRDWALPK